jgi:outer membrane biosynthesis protein TonB
LLRPDRLEISRLVWAIVVSLLLHGASYGIYEGGKSLHLWEKFHMPLWVQKITRAILPATVKNTVKQPPARREPPLMFVEVTPEAAAVEPPKNAKYYAARSSKAANPDAEKDLDIPKISGNQEKIVRTEDSERSKAQPLQPAPQKPEQPAEEAKPKPAFQPGDLTLAKPQQEERKADGAAAEAKPRTVAEAKARQAKQQRPMTAGEKMRQEGGVRRRATASSLDAIGSPFGVYDSAIVMAIQNRWYDLLEERSYANDRSGKVVLEFRLNYDGRVTDLKVVDSTVDELLSLLCQKAILDPAPFARWPSDMRLMAGKDYRDVRFIFYYN